VSKGPFVAVLVERILFGLVNAQVYGSSHARVREAAEGVVLAAGRWCEESREPCVLVGVVDDRIVFEGRPALGASLAAKRLIERVKARGAGGIEIESSAKASDVVALFDLLMRRSGLPEGDLAAARRELEGRGVRDVRFVAPHGSPVTGGDGVTSSVTDAGPLVAMHQEIMDVLQGVTIQACQGQDLDVGRVAHVVDGIVDGLDRDAGVLHELAHYREFDFFTLGHSLRVGLLAVDVARHLTEDHELLQRIGTASLLHDVGKALIPWEVLHKRGALTPDERREIQRHPVLGAGVLLATRKSEPLSVAAAYGHHRTNNDRGYPRSCGEMEQSVVTRLVTICDVFEALTAVRPYKPPLTPLKAFRVMLDMPGHFDPDLLRHFVRIVGIYPAGSRVRLDTGETARVVRQTKDLDRPVVEVVERDGGPVDPAGRLPIDLSIPGSSTATRIAAAIPAPRTEV
jgi:HD-GYP domain-containing protein (c-di-GMP phosphodiesterase class II)